MDELARAAVREWDQLTAQEPARDVWQFRASVARAWAAYCQNASRF